MSARRTRRLKQFDEYPKPERTICLCIEQNMREHKQPFEVVFPWAIGAFERLEILNALVERTTNRKRLRRVWAALGRERAEQAKRAAELHQQLAKTLAGIESGGTF